MKNSLLFAYSTNYLKNPKMCDPILLTLFKMQPHYSQSSRENATSSSGTSPLASYKEVTPLGKCGNTEKRPFSLPSSNGSFQRHGKKEGLQRKSIDYKPRANQLLCERNSLTSVFLLL